MSYALTAVFASLSAAAYGASSILADTDISRTVETGSQLTYAAAATTACVFLFRALMKSQEDRNAMAIAYEQKRKEDADRYTTERMQENARHAEALAKLHAETREEQRQDSAVAEKSRNEMILSIQSLTDRITDWIQVNQK